ncbi:MAG: peptidase U32 family protein [Desulforhopalus sp.]
MGLRKIELLAPARDRGCGVAAIDHGADSVYIGGPRFGARAGAANSLDDIERLVSYAHLFRAKVYVALNTLLDDEELLQAVALCHQLHDIGVDAIIIQDAGLLECQLPPIPLHASTQMNNRTADKVRFLEKVGFRQVVLARELDLERIREIRAATGVTLEFFVHGALCVSYSGQCYISEVATGRSANRGECAQLCRHRYTLRDGRGQTVARDRYLLSLKDLDLSGHLEQLVEAGIDSFKIEGRLKDENYVKNVTASYRKALDRIIDNDSGLQRGSSGRVQPAFTPDTARSFNRGRTDYFLTGRRHNQGVASLYSPKSTGQPLGRVTRSDSRFFTISGNKRLHNGDGLCYLDEKKRLVGIKVNRVEGEKIYPSKPCFLPLGTMIHRNSDTAFNRLVSGSCGCRKIGVQLKLSESTGGLLLEMVDEDKITSRSTVAFEKTAAEKSGAVIPLAVKQLRKCGGTCFSVDDIHVDLDGEYYISAALFNRLRRAAFQRHMEVRVERSQVERCEHTVNEIPWPQDEITYLDNISNNKALAFYRRHGVSRVSQTLRAAEVENCAVMTTKYCIRAQLHCCPKFDADGGKLVEPLTLVDKSAEYLLHFDCRKCEMSVVRGRGRG